jgi:hypothetical protein
MSATISLGMAAAVPFNVWAKGSTEWYGDVGGTSSEEGVEVAGEADRRYRMCRRRAW